MTTAVDTNVPLDILLYDPRYVEWSKSRLEKARKGGELIICEAVYAELAAVFEDEAELVRFLSDVGIMLRLSTFEVLTLAGKAWRRYVLRRGRAIRCPTCGRGFLVKCPRCGAPVMWRQHILSDFLIGAHAQVMALRLLTRDRGYYRTYFPDLTLME